MKGGTEHRGHRQAPLIDGVADVPEVAAAAAAACSGWCPAQSTQCMLAPDAYKNDAASAPYSTKEHATCMGVHPEPRAREGGGGAPETSRTCACTGSG